MHKLATWFHRTFSRNPLERELNPPLQLPVVFRPYQKNDFDSLSEIYDLNAPNRFPEDHKDTFIKFLTETENGIMIGELNGKPISCAGLVDHGSGVFMLCYGLVHPDYKGNRIGSTMTLLRIAATAKNSPPEAVLTSLINAVPSSISFYEQLGFQKFGIWKEIDGKKYPSAVARYYTFCAMRIEDTFRRRKLLIQGEFLPAISRREVAEFVHDEFGNQTLTVKSIEQTGANIASTDTTQNKNRTPAN